MKPPEKNHGNQPKTMKTHETTLKNQKRDLRGVTTDQGRGGRAGITKNVTHAGSYALEHENQKD